MRQYIALGYNTVGWESCSSPTAAAGFKREIHPKLSKNVGAVNSCRSLAVSLPGSNSSRRRRRASRQTSFKCALKFHQLATSRKPSRQLGGLGCWSCRIWPGEVPAEFATMGSATRSSLVCFPRPGRFSPLPSRLHVDYVPHSVSRLPIDSITAAGCSGVAREARHPRGPDAEPSRTSARIRFPRRTREQWESYRSTRWNTLPGKHFKILHCAMPVRATQSSVSGHCPLLFEHL